MCGAKAPFFYYIVGYPRVMMYTLFNSRSDLGEWWYVCIHTSVMTMAIRVWAVEVFGVTEWMVWVQSAGENLKSSNQGHKGGVWFIFEYLFRPSKGRLYDVPFMHHPVVVGGLFLGQKKGGWLETRLASMKCYNLMILYEWIPLVHNSVASWDLTEFEGIPKCQTTSRWLRRERNLL